MSKVIDFISLMEKIDELKIWAFTNQREETVTPPVVPPVIPPVGILGSKTNPIKLNKMYAPVTNGFTHSSKGKEFGLASGAKVYFEVDPVLLKPNAPFFQMVVKGMNCPTLYIYKAYYDKNTQTYTDDVSFTSGGCVDPVRDLKPRDLDSTKFLYALENKGASWGIELWVQMY